MMRLAFIYTVLYFMYMYNIILHLTDGHRQMSITVIAWATEDQILISVRTDMVEFGPVCSRTGTGTGITLSRSDTTTLKMNNLGL